MKASGLAINEAGSRGMHHLVAFANALHKNQDSRFSFMGTRHTLKSTRIESKIIQGSLSRAQSVTHRSRRCACLANYPISTTDWLRNEGNIRTSYSKNTVWNFGAFEVGYSCHAIPCSQWLRFLYLAPGQLTLGFL